MLNKLELMTRKEFAAIADEAIVILPLGSIEQHGEHLPLCTDTAIVSSIVHASVQKLAGRNVSPIILAPPMYVGSSHHHLFSVALSLSVETYVALLKDLVRSLANSGVRRVLMINGHGGNDLAMKMVCNDVVLEQEITVGAFSYWNPGYTPDSDGDIELDHAGLAETSLMLYMGYEIDTTAVAGPTEQPIFDVDFGAGVVVNRFQEWEKIGGITQSPAQASSEIGAAFHQRRVAQIAKTIELFDKETK